MLPRLISKADEGEEVHIYSFVGEILETEIITVLYVIMCHQCVFESIVVEFMTKKRQLKKLTYAR